MSHYPSEKNQIMSNSLFLCLIIAEMNQVTVQNGIGTTLDSGKRAIEEDWGGMFANEGRFFKGSKGGAKSTRHILSQDPDEMSIQD